MRLAGSPILGMNESQNGQRDMMVDLMQISATISK
jgi:hypothetical protein